ncbi:MAG: hypothetical protein V4590_04490 [Bacteroidota bacterium]
MKSMLLPLFSISLTLLIASCAKDDSDSNASKAQTTTTSGSPVVVSSDYLIFSTDTVKQFTITQSVVSNHFTVKATHITSDPVVMISLSEASFPATVPANYTVSQSALTTGKCGATITYGGRFYVVNSGSLAVSIVSGKKRYTLSNFVCVSTSDPQARTLKGILSFN